MTEQVIGNLALDMIEKHIGNGGTFSLVASEKGGRVQWKAFAEIVVRGKGFKQWKAEGRDLDRAIRDCVGQAPANPHKRKVVRVRRQ